MMRQCMRERSLGDSDWQERGRFHIRKVDEGTSLATACTATSSATGHYFGAELLSLHASIAQSRESSQTHDVCEVLALARFRVSKRPLIWGCFNQVSQRE
eukprot:4860609-Pleurochrysis_carterae.AAC.1